jgi:hypothetical protein
MKINAIAPRAGALVLLLCSGVFQLHAQFGTATVLGSVHDASGSVVTRSQVSLVNQETGITARTFSDENGNFNFNEVKVGLFTVSAEAPGFSRGEAKDMVVNVNARQRVDLVLQVGATSETVEVNAAAALLNTDTSDRGQVVNKVSITELPLNGRQFSDLALLTTGVNKSPSSGSREGSFIVNGLRSTYNNYLLDGIDNNAYGTSNQGFSNQVAQPSPDSVVEFEVVTSNYSAEYGRSGGATIISAMRSGTNSFHGSAYEFLRNTDLNATGFQFGLRPSTFKKPTLSQNQFGATFGGPVIKNRVFFFTDYEGFRNIQRTLSFSSLPTLADRQGIFPVAVTNPLTGATYAANTPIPTSAMSPLAVKVLNALPTPTDRRPFQQLSAVVRRSHEGR